MPDLRESRSVRWYRWLTRLYPAPFRQVRERDGHAGARPAGGGFGRARALRALGGSARRSVHHRTSRARPHADSRSPPRRARAAQNTSPDDPGRPRARRGHRRDDGGLHFGECGAAAAAAVRGARSPGAARRERTETGHPVDGHHAAEPARLPACEPAPAEHRGVLRVGIHAHRRRRTGACGRGIGQLEPLRPARRAAGARAHVPSRRGSTECRYGGHHQPRRLAASIRRRPGPDRPRPSRWAASRARWSG